MDMIEEKRQGMRLRTKLVLVLIVLLLIVGAVSGAFLYGMKRGGQTAEPVVTSDLLGQQLRSARELVSVEYYYTNMAKYENQLDFYGWKVPFTTKTFIVSYDGVIKAGVDLSSVQVSVDEGNKMVTVTLPDSQIISHEIPEDSVEVFNESDNVFNRITITDYTAFTGDQKEDMEQKAAENGLLVRADEEAEATVTFLLGIMPGMENYTLRVEKAT